MKKTKALVLLSGGQDSTTCLATALQECDGKVETICFDYNQRHQTEIVQAQKIAELAQVPIKIVPLPFISHLTENALTRRTIQIHQDKDQLPNTFVAGRNLFFLSIAAAYAYSKNISIIYGGMCETDYSGYPDCRNNFIQSLNQSINLAMDRSFELRMPLMWLTKAETVKKMASLGKLSWYAHTHTCYEGRRPACGKCPSCLLRIKGFREANIEDPLEYD